MSWFSIDPKPISYTPPSWSSGTDEEIVEALTKHYNGEVDLTEYWSIGDERTVHLSAMDAYHTYMPDTHVAQDVTMVLMNKGGKVLSSDHTTECAFVVGQKECLLEAGRMDYFNNIYYWDTCNRRNWCNTTYKNAIPSSIRSIFKQFDNMTRGSSGVITSEDYFALPAKKEVFGNSDPGSSAGDESFLSQFEYYETSSNITKTINETGYNYVSWWLRSPYMYISEYDCFLFVTKRDGYDFTNTNSANGSCYFSPFGVI